MKFRLQIVAMSDSGQEQVKEVTRFEREGVEMETLGLTLAEGKLILQKVQEGMVQEQITDYLTQRRCCPDCGQVRQRKGHHDCHHSYSVWERAVAESAAASLVSRHDADHGDETDGQRPGEGSESAG